MLKHPRCPQVSAQSPRLAALLAAGLVALSAHGASAEPPALAELPGAAPETLAAALREGALVLAAPLVLAAALWHRALRDMGAVLLARLDSRLAPRGAQHGAPAEVLAAAKHLPLSDDLGANLKARMTEVHRHLRALAPELLPAFAELRAAQNRLLSEARRHPGAAAATSAQLIGGLVQIEAATRKLSVVLPSEAKEYALGSYADALEKLSGETMDCLIDLRARAKGAVGGMQLAGGTRHA